MTFSRSLISEADSSLLFSIVRRKCLTVEDYQVHAWHEVGFQRTSIMKCKLKLLAEDRAPGTFWCEDLGAAAAQALLLQMPVTEASPSPPRWARCSP